MLGALMTQRDQPSLLEVVALLSDLAEQGLVRGQVGTVVELLDEGMVLVEFSDDQGRAYAIVPCRASQLLVLRYVPEAA
jgi:hypothetical protein